jgi:hypothetical protein
LGDSNVGTNIRVLRCRDQQCLLKATLYVRRWIAELRLTMMYHISVQMGCAGLATEHGVCRSWRCG